jgi:biofilm PGA synthesis protein PgaA
MYPVDLHMHTVASTHAYSTLSDYIAQAKQKGIKLFAITDHGPDMEDAPHHWHFINMRIWPRVVDGVGILRGIEANIKNVDGEIDCSGKMFDSLDLIIAGFHEPVFAPHDKATNTQAMIATIASGNVHIISHPGNPKYEIDVKAVAEAAAKHQVALEMIARELAYNAPGNQGLRIDYASVLQARGWPRAAENELKKAEVIEPRNINLEVEQAWTALTLQEWQQAAVLTHDVVEREPQDPGVVRLKRAVDVHNLAELRIAGSTGIDAEGPDSGKHDVDLTTIVYSPPLKDNWRGFAGFGYADGQFSEGKGIVRDWLAGVEWRSRNIWLEAEYAERVFNHEHKPGARLSGWYDFNDNWRIGSQLERLSHRVPLRAMKNGVTGNSAQAYVRWYQNERRKYGVSWAFTDFSDSNQRQEVSLEGQERIWSSPYLIVDFLPNLYYEQNTEHDTPYYNPIKTFDIVPAFEASHLLWRSYENSWEQIFSAGVGASWQKHYGTDVVTQLGYGQRISWNDVIDAGATLRWEKRPYDGDREHNLYVEFDMTFRF